MTASSALRCVLISDFNVETLSRLMANDVTLPALSPVESPFGQVHQLLANPEAPVWREKPELAVVWTRPEVQLPSLARLLNGEEPGREDEVISDVDAFLQALDALDDRVRFTLVPTWTLPPTKAFAMLGARPGMGVRHALLRANLRLLEGIAERKRLYALDSASWFSGASSFSAKLWHLSKNPYVPAVHKGAVAAIKSAVRTLLGGSRKLIVLDLDNTMWGGILGEVGWQNLRLGGHDAIGEAFVEFQDALRSLLNRGILLAICSRNDEAVALEAIRQHPEMRLRLEDFVGWRINWGDKAQNVAELAAAVNLGLDSIVFIDDDPAQRARVREALPQVLVPEWPGDPMLYASSLLELDCFDSIGLSQEDRARTRMYVADRERNASRAAISFEDWLHQLGVVVTCDLLGEANLARATQLLNKTNQMNMATRRLSDVELMTWSQLPGHRVWTFRVSDRYGDLGLTGLLGMRIQDGRGEIVDFLLSCRAMGRKVEETMLAVAVAHARTSGAHSLTARFVPTAKNRPCLEFWEGSGWDRGEDGVFAWDVRKPCPVPGHVRLEGSVAPIGSDTPFQSGDRDLGVQDKAVFGAS